MVRLRSVTVQDVPSLCALQHSARAEDDALVRPYELENLLERRARGWVAECQGQACGYAIVRLADATLHGLYVRPEWQSQGVGSLLMRHVSRFSQRCGHRQLRLATSNHWQAQAFYQRHGWTRLHQAGHHQIMVRQLR